MRRRDDDRLEQILDEHFRMLETQFAKGIGRRCSCLCGARARIDSRESAGGDERGHRGRLGLEHRLLDVTEILAVRLEGERTTAPNDDAVAVVKEEPHEART